MNTIEDLSNNSNRLKKVLQLYVGGEPYLVLGSLGKRHPEILTEFLNRAGIAFAEQKLQKGWMGPPVKTEYYRLAGAGLAVLRGDDIELFHRSSKYDIPVDGEHAKIIAAMTKRKVYLRE